jgi:hypothetical protein
MAEAGSLPCAEEDMEEDSAAQGEKKFLRDKSPRSGAVCTTAAGSNGHLLLLSCL